MKPTGGPAERIERWLLYNLPPLDGRLRLVFYGGSLALFVFLNDGLSFTLRDASPSLYEPRGITALLGVPYFPPAAMRALMAGTYLAWLCAAVGLLTRPAKVLTAAGMLLALGFEQAYETGANHSHYLLLYSLAFLSFSTSDRDWSVDAWLRRRGLPPEVAGGAPSLGATGLPRNAILIVAVALYFASGLSKLTDAGLRWIDGQSLQYYIASQAERTSFELVTSLRVWVAGQGWLTAMLSAGTLLVELGSPLALFSRRLRHLWIPAWISMHLGIVLLMAPNYWIHSWCVGVLFTDWLWLRRVWESRSFTAAERLHAGPAADDVRPAAGEVQAPPAPPGPAWSARLRALGVLLVLLAGVPALAQIEWFPLTHVPMYASYVTPQAIGGVPVVDFGDETRVRELARRCAADRVFGYIRRCPWHAPRALLDRVTLDLLRPESEPVRFPGDVGGLRHPVIARLAASSAREEAVSAAALTERVRALLLARAPRSAPGYDRFRLEYALSEGTILLAEGAVEAPR